MTQFLGSISSMRFLMSVLVAIAATAGSAEGADVDIMGAGAQSCGSWTADHRDGIPIAGDQWILGFLSGVAYEGPGPTVLNPLNGLDAPAVWAWVTNYCLAHPLEQIVGAGTAFLAAHPR
jgi:hypothetical protein